MRLIVRKAEKIAEEENSYFHRCQEEVFSAGAGSPALSRQAARFQRALIAERRCWEAARSPRIPPGFSREVVEERPEAKYNKLTPPQN